MIYLCWPVISVSDLTTKKKEKEKVMNELRKGEIVWGHAEESWFEFFMCM